MEGRMSLLDLLDIHSPLPFGPNERSGFDACQAIGNLLEEVELAYGKRTALTLEGLFETCDDCSLLPCGM